MGRSFSSGDLIADRRFEYARMLMAEGDAAAAADLLDQLLDIAPLWPVAWSALGDARAALDDLAGARAAYDRCLSLAPQDELGASLKRAALAGGAVPDHPPSAYVRELFDDYAARFEEELVERLDYHTPERLARLIGEVAARPFGRVLDIGCGTGLMGEAIRTWAGHITGLDLAPAMVDQARQKGCYDALMVGDATGLLAAGEEPFDLIVAADVLVYVGALDRLMAAAAARLAPDGLLAISAEAADGDEMELRPSLRYAHSLAYLDRLAGESGLARLGYRRTTLRKDRGEAIAGHLVVYGRAI